MNQKITVQVLWLCLAFQSCVLTTLAQTNSNSRQNRTIAVQNSKDRNLSSGNSHEGATILNRVETESSITSTFSVMWPEEPLNIEFLHILEKGLKYMQRDETIVYSGILLYRYRKSEGRKVLMEAVARRNINAASVLAINSETSASEMIKQSIISALQHNAAGKESLSIRPCLDGLIDMEGIKLRPFVATLLNKYPSNAWVSLAASKLGMVDYSNQIKTQYDALDSQDPDKLLFACALVVLNQADNKELFNLLKHRVSSVNLKDSLVDSLARDSILEAYEFLDNPMFLDVVCQTLRNCISIRQRNKLSEKDGLIISDYGTRLVENLGHFKLPEHRQFARQWVSVLLKKSGAKSFDVSSHEYRSCIALLKWQVHQDEGLISSATSPVWVAGAKRVVSLKNVPSHLLSFDKATLGDLTQVMEKLK